MRYLKTVSEFLKEDFRFRDSGVVKDFNSISMTPAQIAREEEQELGGNESKNSFKDYKELESRPNKVIEHHLKENSDDKDEEEL